MHEALGFISSTGRWEIQRKHDSGLWVVQKLLALLLESALMEKRGHKHWKGWHLAAWFELTAYLHFLGDPWAVKDKTLTSTEVWEDDVLSENTTWWGLCGPRLFAMCVLRLISKDSSEEAEPLQSLNKPHGLPGQSGRAAMWWRKKATISPRNGSMACRLYFPQLWRNSWHQ